MNHLHRTVSALRLAKAHAARLMLRRPRVLDLAEQLGADFGRHRSGLKYGLNYLSVLHVPGGVVLDAFIERTFSWHPEGPRAHQTPWVGMVHVPPDLPDWFHPELSHQAIFGSELWRRSAPFCRGLFAYSKHHASFLQDALGVPVDPLLLPTETVRPRWSWTRFEANSDRKLVQIGWWLRRLHSIYQVHSPLLRKARLDVGHESVPKLMAIERELLRAQNGFDAALNETVDTISFLSNRDYDRLLAENVVFLHLYDASANNAIVECMVRHTPLLVNPLPAVVEYLGNDYPLYFETLEEASAKLADFDLINRTHIYLRDHLTSKQLDGVSFLRSVATSRVYRGLESTRS